MLSAIRRAVTGWRFRKMTRRFDEAIKDARARHRPVNHLIAAKREFVHACLRGRA